MTFQGCFNVERKPAQITPFRFFQPHERFVFQFGTHPHLLLEILPTVRHDQITIQRAWCVDIVHAQPTRAVQFVVPGHDLDTSSSLAQAPDLVVLESTIHRDDLHVSIWIVHHGLLDGHLRHQIARVRILHEDASRVTPIHDNLDWRFLMKKICPIFESVIRVASQ